MALTAILIEMPKTYEELVKKITGVTSAGCRKCIRFFIKVWAYWDDHGRYRPEVMEEPMCHPNYCILSITLNRGTRNCLRIVI